MSWHQAIPHTHNSKELNYCSLSLNCKDRVSVLWRAYPLLEISVCCSPSFTTYVTWTSSSGTRQRIWLRWQKIWRLEAWECVRVSLSSGNPSGKAEQAPNYELRHWVSSRSRDRILRLSRLSANTWRLRREWWIMAKQHCHQLVKSLPCRLVHTKWQLLEWGS